MPNVSVFKQTTHGLMYAGLLPFVVLATCHACGWQNLPYVGKVQFVFAVYGLVIHSFMAGTHWTKARMNKKTTSIVFSNMLTIISFFLFICLSSLHFIWSMIGLYASTLWQDSVDSEPDYLSVRKHLTIVIVLCCLIMAVPF